MVGGTSAVAGRTTQHNAYTAVLSAHWVVLATAILDVDFCGHSKAQCITQEVRGGVIVPTAQSQSHRKMTRIGCRSEVALRFVTLWHSKFGSTDLSTARVSVLQNGTLVERAGMDSTADQHPNN